MDSLQLQSQGNSFIDSSYQDKYISQGQGQSQGRSYQDGSSLQERNTHRDKFNPISSLLYANQPIGNQFQRIQQYPINNNGYNVPNYQNRNLFSNDFHDTLPMDNFSSSGYGAIYPNTQYIYPNNEFTNGASMPSTRLENNLQNNMANNNNLAFMQHNSYNHFSNSFGKSMKSQIYNIFSEEPNTDAYIQEIESDDEMIDIPQPNPKVNKGIKDKNLTTRSHNTRSVFHNDDEEYFPIHNDNFPNENKTSINNITNNIQTSNLISSERGCVKLSSKVDKYNLFMMDDLLYIRRDKCLAFEITLPFELPNSQPIIKYYLKVRQRDATQYTDVYKDDFVEYEFNGNGVKQEIATIPDTHAHIDRERRILKIPFKLTKGQKDLVEGYKNIFKLQFIIQWPGYIGCSIWFSFRYDSRGNEKKSSYKSVTHVCGLDNVWISPMGKDSSIEFSKLKRDTPIIYMEPNIVEE